LAMDQDLLEPLQFLTSVIAVTVRPDMGGPQEADLVIMVQRPDRDARHSCNLFDRMHDRSLSPAPSAGPLDSPSRHVRVNTPTKSVAFYPFRQQPVHRVRKHPAARGFRLPFSPPRGRRLPPWSSWGEKRQ